MTSSLDAHRAAQATWPDPSTADLRAEAADALFAAMRARKAVYLTGGAEAVTQ